ncbi:hypothetical protein HaLaN_21477, partial [Haematococcus lacustris]
MSKNMFKEE